MATDTWQSALDGREDLSRYGDNALLLFALALHEDIEDVELVANDALTDGSNDKKCDLVHISSERGRIIVAQGYWSTRERKGAPVNKASDLNTAVTWLLGGDSSKMPETLRNAAEQVRSALKDGDATSIDIWYVHNLPESENVKKELEQVESTCHSLVKSLFSDAAVDSVRALEVGRGTLESWYRGTKAPILVTDKFEFETTGGFFSSGNRWSAYSTSVPATWLRDMFRQHGRDLFSANVRDYLGSRRSDKNINNNIKTTARQSPEMFWVYNNGITALVNDFKYTSEDDLGVPPVPTSDETAPPGNLCTDGRRMDHRSCPNQPIFPTVSLRRRVSADRLARAALPSRACRRGPAESLVLPTSSAS